MDQQSNSDWDGDYQLVGTFVPFEPLLYDEPCAAAGVPLFPRKTLRVTDHGTRVQISGCAIAVSPQATRLVASDAECEILPESNLRRLGLKSRVFEWFEFDREHGSVREVIRSVRDNGIEIVDECGFVNSTVEAVEEPPAKSDHDRITQIWVYERGAYTTFEKRPLDPAAGCGQLVRSGGQPWGRIREHADGTFLLEGFDCRAPLVEALSEPDAELVPCVPGSHHGEELPTLWLRQFSLSGERLILDGGFAEPTSVTACTSSRPWHEKRREATG